MNDRLIVVRVDGGFCSQLAFYALAKELEEYVNNNGGGGIIKLDLTWFEIHGKDMYGNFDRSYVLHKAFPNICHYAKASQEDILMCKEGMEIDYKPNYFSFPLYISSYPECMESLFKYRQFFIDNFCPVDLDSIKDYIDEIEQTNSCAIHVRRGDLSNYCASYGYPPSYEYFSKAIEIIKSLHSDTIFYFFSDEPDWVLHELIPNIQNIEYKIYDRNDSSKGYLDVYAISKCKNIIASQGSIGYFAKILSRNDNQTLIMPNTCGLYPRVLNNIIAINHGITMDKCEQDVNEHKNLSLRYRLYIKVFNHLKIKLQNKNII